MMANPIMRILSGMSGSMLAAVAGTLIVCAYGTFMLDAARVLPGDYHSLDADIAESQSAINELSASPVLPPLTESWREVVALMELLDVSFVPLDVAEGNSPGGTYEGPLKSWSGTVKGNAQVVLAAVKKAQQTNPVFLLNYTAEGGVFTLNLAVVGI